MWQMMMMMMMYNNTCRLNTNDFVGLTLVIV